MNTFQAHSATSKAQEVRKQLDPAASLPHGHPLATARAAELLRLAQVLPWHLLAPPGQGDQAPEPPFCPPDLLQQQGETEQGSGLTQVCGELSGWSTAGAKKVEPGPELPV